MNIKAYIRMCMLLILFLFTSGFLCAQVTETKKTESADSINQTGGSPPSGAEMLEQNEDRLGNPIQTRSCVPSFTSQTVSGYLVVTGCDTLFVQGVTVTSTGDLVLQAPNTINIHGAFEVALGGQLNVNTIPPPPPGNTMQTAINIGTFGSPFQYTDSRNTVSYTNDYVGQSTNDVFYVFTITTAMNITIRHCDSQIATYLHLLNASGTSMATNGGYSGPGGCANSAHACLKQYLTPGTYYIVSEGYSANGIIQTEVIGELPQPSFEYTYDTSGNRITRTFVP